MLDQASYAKVAVVADREQNLGAFGWLWMIAVAGLPFYVFDSGKPQPSDFGFLLLSLGALGSWGASIPPRLRKTTIPLIVYSVIVLLVNTVWSTMLNFNTQFHVRTGFVLFNGIVFAGMLAMATRAPDHFIRITTRTVAFSILLQGLLMVPFSGRNLSGRLMLFFNNPNQLGYYILGAATVVVMGAERAKLPRWVIVLCMVAASLLIYRTYSRSSLIGMVILVMISLSRNPLRLGLALAPLTLIGMLVTQSIQEDNMWAARIEHARQGDTREFLEDRGLERLVSHPEHLLLGSGEGDHYRFHAIGLELHSSFAGVAFYYGILGIFSLLWFFFSVANASGPRSAMLLLPVLAYNFFHNGLRARMFWFVLAMAISATYAAILAKQREEDEPERESMVPERVSLPAPIR